jgi:hypothetical protein
MDTSPTNEELFHPGLPKRKFFAGIDAAIDIAPEPLAAVARVFKQNIEAADTVLNLPREVVHASLQLSMITMLHAAERIRRLKVPEDSESSAITSQSDSHEELSVKIPEGGDQTLGDDDPEALKAALAKFNEEIERPGAMDALRERARQTLRNYQRLRPVQDGARELRHQGCVMLWVALEVLARDLFVCTLNARPELSLALLKDETSKRLFDVKSIGINDIINNGFNLADKMGALLIERHPIDTIPAMKAAYYTIQPNNNLLRSTLESRDLWLLFQRRHLIVHRRGVVDKEYLDSTGETLPLGIRLEIAVNEIARYFMAVRDAGLQMINTATAALRASR